jgi:MFS family permease
MSRGERRLRARLVVLTCALSVFIVSTDTNTVNVALPALHDEFDVPLTSLQFLISAYTTALACFYLLSGTLGDRFGRRNVFVVGLVAFAAGSAMCAAAWTFPVLVAFRVIQAAGAATLAPMAMAILGDEFPERAERARAVAVWAVAGGVGAGFGPIAGGVLVTTIGWRGIYLATIPFALLALVLAATTVRNIARTDRPPLNLAPQGLLAVALCALLVVAAHGGASGFDALTIGATAALALAAAALFFLERRNRAPLLDGRLFRAGPFAGALVAIAAGFFLLGGTFVLVAFFMQESLGLSALLAGVVMTAWAAGSVVASRLIGSSSSRRPAGFFYAAIGVLAAIGVTALSLAGFSEPTGPAIALVLVGLATAGAAFATANTATSIFGLDGVDVQILGRAAAFLSVARQVAQSLGVALTAVVFSSAVDQGQGQAAYVSSYLFLLGVVVLLLCLVPLASGWAGTRRRATT